MTIIDLMTTVSFAGLCFSVGVFFGCLIEKISIKK